MTQVDPVTNKIYLAIDEDTKLGEKLFQIHIDQKLASNQLAIIYFNLIDAEWANPMFYLSNNDGALYLVRYLDYESCQSYNLTVLVTNWLGQIEYVHIEVIVRDTNDNRPVFVNSSSVLNYTLDLTNNNDEELIDLVAATDQDRLDWNKLVFNLEQCFYMSSNILVSKKPNLTMTPSQLNLAYPICSTKFMTLETKTLDKQTQQVALKLSRKILIDYLNESTDFYLHNVPTSSLLNFYLDISVNDLSPNLATVTRVNLNIILNRPKDKKIELVSFKSVETSSATTNNSSVIAYGFRKPVYLLKIKPSQLANKSVLIRLANEFYWFQPRFGHDSVFRTFAAFELTFFIIESNSQFIQIEPHLGQIYFNQTLDKKQPMKNQIFQLDIGCRLNNNQFSRDMLGDLFNTTKLIVMLEDDNLLGNNAFYEDLIYYRPIWASDKYIAFVDENSPIGTWISVENRSFTAALHLDMNTIEQLMHEIPFFKPQLNQQINFHIENLNQVSDYFEIETLTGFVRTKSTIDFEQNQSFDLVLKVCLNNLAVMQINKPICFRDTSVLTVQVRNRNDNEPKPSALSSHQLNINLLNTSQLYRSMSLFKFRATDADNNLTALTYKLMRVRSNLTSSGCPMNSADLISWFELFQLSQTMQCIRLSDVGFDDLILLSSQINQQQLRTCHFQIELVSSVSDGLFTNQIHFNLNILFDQLSRSAKNNAFANAAPVIRTIELIENTNSNDLLVNLQEAMLNYMLTTTHNKTDLYKPVFKFELKNYENIFKLDEQMLQLIPHAMSELDRENRDTYELFIGCQVNMKLSTYFVPAHVRVLIKLIDMNDNSPRFYQPYEAGLPKIEFVGYEQSFKWSEHINSNKYKPILTVNAMDADYGLNGVVEYYLNASNLNDYELANFFIKLDRESGCIYLNPKLSSNHTLLDLIWNNYSASNLVLKFILIARDSSNANQQLEKKLDIQLTFLFTSKSNFTTDVYFKQTYYYFEVPESLQTNSVFAHVNSALRFDHQNQSDIIYSLVAGDDYNHFDIDYKTGNLNIKI